MACMCGMRGMYVAPPDQSKDPPYVRTRTTQSTKLMLLMCTYLRQALRTLLRLDLSVKSAHLVRSS